MLNETKCSTIVHINLQMTIKKLKDVIREVDLIVDTLQPQLINY